MPSRRHDDGEAVHLSGIDMFQHNIQVGPLAFNALATIGLGGADEVMFLAGISLWTR